MSDESQGDSPSYNPDHAEDESSDSSHNTTPTPSGSDLESQENQTHPTRHAHSASARPTKSPRAFEDSSSEENDEHKRRRRKAGRHKPRKSRVPDVDIEVLDSQPVSHDGKPRGAIRARRFDWSHGPGRDARSYLESRLDEWGSASTAATRRAIATEAAEHVVNHYVFDHHNSGDVRKAVRVWFRNAQRRAPPLIDPAPAGPAGSTRDELPSHVTSQVVKELQNVIKGRPTSAAALWAKENDAAVRGMMEGTGIGERQRAMKQGFGALPDSEQQAWRERAKAEAAQADADPNKCFDNQRIFTQLLAKVLDQFPGFGPENFGSLVIYTRIAMRDREGIVTRDELTVGASPDVECPSFAAFEGGAHLAERDRWERFLSQALPNNPLRGDPRLICMENGKPMLPQVNNAWVRDDVVAVLDSYFRLVWAQSRSSEKPLNWDDINAEPERYVSSPWQDLGATNPNTYNLLDLILLYSKLLQAQQRGTPFEFRAADNSEEVLAPLDAPRLTSTAGERQVEPSPDQHEVPRPKAVHPDRLGRSQAIPFPTAQGMDIAGPSGTSAPHTPTMPTRRVKVFPTPLPQSGGSAHTVYETPSRARHARPPAVLPGTLSPASSLFNPVGSALATTHRNLFADEDDIVDARGPTQTRASAQIDSGRRETVPVILSSTTQEERGMDSGSSRDMPASTEMADVTPRAVHPRPRKRAAPPSASAEDAERTSSGLSPRRALHSADPEPQPPPDMPEVDGRGAHKSNGGGSDHTAMVSVMFYSGDEARGLDDEDEHATSDEPRDWNGRVRKRAKRRGPQLTIPGVKGNTGRTDARSDEENGLVVEVAGRARVGTRTRVGGKAADTSRGSLELEEDKAEAQEGDALDGVQGRKRKRESKAGSSKAGSSRPTYDDEDTISSGQTHDEDTPRQGGCVARSCRFAPAV
ncbi:hypothetical protein C2E23DRAFT_885096 [Lenzites betulinus]|nr:hypothetical protein C2E23DRAFT_885096 [Lenzites betulinus]